MLIPFIIVLPVKSPPNTTLVPILFKPFTPSVSTVAPSSVNELISPAVEREAKVAAAVKLTTSNSPANAALVKTAEAEVNEFVAPTFPVTSAVSRVATKIFEVSPFFFVAA